MSVAKKTADARSRAVRRALGLLLAEHPDAEYVIVSATQDGDELDMTCMSNVPPEHAVKLLGFGADDYQNRTVKVMTP